MNKLLFVPFERINFLWPNGGTPEGQVVEGGMLMDPIPVALSAQELMHKAYDQLKQLQGTLNFPKPTLVQVINGDCPYGTDLRHYFRALFNSRGANNPYHNIRHACTVLMRAYEGLVFHCEDIGQEDSLARPFLISSLLHDLNHSGRAGNDDLNIQLAIRALRKIILPQDKDIADYIEDFISITEFGPNGHVYSYVGELAKILQDADLTQICSDAWIRMVLFGLSEEMSVTPIEMLKMQEKFLSGVSFKSKWGQQFAPMIKQKIEESRELLKILE